jgi:hypothetical protein
LNKKQKKLGVFGEVGFRGMLEKKREIGDFGGRRWVWVVGNGRRWSFGGGEGGCRRWVWVIFGFREERDGGAVSGCTAGGKEMGKRKKN